MLYDDLDEVCRHLDTLDPDTEAATLVDYAMSQWSDPQSTREARLELANKLIMPILKAIPGTIQELRRTVDDPATPPALRTTILLCLAYVARTTDTVPDDAPGGYGFIDDAIILLLILKQVAEVRGLTADEQVNHALVSALLASVLPPAKREEVTALGNQVVALFQLMAQSPAEILAIADAIILANPAAAPTPTVPGFTPVPTFTLPGSEAHVTMHPGGGSTYSEPGLLSMSFAGGGGASMVGNDILVWD